MGGMALRFKHYLLSGEFCSGVLSVAFSLSNLRTKPSLVDRHPSSVGKLDLNLLTGVTKGQQRLEDLARKAGKAKKMPE